jgi:hypothetical protein
VPQLLQNPEPASILLPQLEQKEADADWGGAALLLPILTCGVIVILPLSAGFFAFLSSERINTPIAKTMIKAIIKLTNPDITLVLP